MMETRAATRERVRRYGLFIGATKAREMRNAMLASVALTLPIALALQGYGNHGLWIALLTFMAVRGIMMGLITWNLARKNLWIPAVS